MLILTRRSGESIVIGEDIQVTIMGVAGGQVKIGVRAPKSVRVDREEIALRRDAEIRALEEHLHEKPGVPA